MCSYAHCSCCFGGCTRCSAATWLIGCGAGSNRCACLLKLHKLDKALADAQQCVSLRGDWDKAHYRVGSALEALGRHAEVRRPVPHCIRRVPLLATTEHESVKFLPCTAAAVRLTFSRQGTSSRWLHPCCCCYFAVTLAAPETTNPATYLRFDVGKYGCVHFSMQAAVLNCEGLVPT